MRRSRSFSPVAPADLESELVFRCRRYETEALAEFFERFHDLVFGFLAVRTGDPGLAEELTRECLLRALGLLPRYRNRGAGLGPWLLRIANGRLAERLPSNSAGPAALPAPGVAGVADSDPARLRAALDRLPKDEQEVLALRFLAHLSLGEVARALHRGTGATERLQARALKSLNRLLSPPPEPTVTG